MMRADCHMHTSFSADAASNPVDMIESAIEKGLDTICFTDHLDYDFPKMNDKWDLTFDLDTENYLKRMQELQEEYQDRIKIRRGVELGLQPHLGQRYKEYVAS